MGLAIIYTAQEICPILSQPEGQELLQQHQQPAWETPVPILSQPEGQELRQGQTRLPLLRTDVPLLSQPEGQELHLFIDGLL